MRDGARQCHTAVKHSLTRARENDYSISTGTSDKSDVTTLALEPETAARPTPSFVSAPPTLNDLAVRYGTDKRIGIHS